MTIEHTLERIATALEAIAGHLEPSIGLVSYGPPADAAPPRAELPPTGEVKRGPGRPSKKAPKPVVEDDDFLAEDEPAPVAKAYTRDDVRQALVRVQKATENPEQARKLLQAQGVETLHALPEDKFAAVIQAATAAAAR